MILLMMDTALWLTASTASSWRLFSSDGTESDIYFCFSLAELSQPPVDERIVDKRLQHGHEVLFVLSHCLHHVFIRESDFTFHSAHFHGVDEHLGEVEKAPSPGTCPFTCHLEAVPKTDVYDLSTRSSKHQVVQVAVSEAKQVVDNGHDSEVSLCSWCICPAKASSWRF